MSSKRNPSQNIHDPIEKADQDVLERQGLAQRIFERISQSDTGIFGIYGGWGTGKTSLLHLMRGLSLAESASTYQNIAHVEIIDAWKVVTKSLTGLP
jgi:ABC-type molybdate transport system ATPase subunit